MAAKSIVNNLILRKIMRGSVYYQTAELTKIIFENGAKKIDRTNPYHSHFNKISSYTTMKSYRDIWNNFFNYLREHWVLKDCEQIEEQHILAYLDYKIEYYPSKQYLQKIVSALGKLETALISYTQQKYGEAKVYNFDIRHFLLKEAYDLKLVANNYHNRAYKFPHSLIHKLTNPLHRIAAKIELEGGARVEACSLIKPDQLRQFCLDKISKKEKGVLFTKEKGGKEGFIYISIETYTAIDTHIKSSGLFKINRFAYMKDIREACLELNINSEGTHGFRWNFAQNRLFEYANANYTYEQSLLLISKEMKHNRASITEHYIGY